MTEPALRRLRPEDDRSLFAIFRQTIADLLERQGQSWPWDPTDESEWQGWRSLFEHVRATSDEAWGAELDGELLGYARSIRRGDSRELTEFFVLPAAQGRGMGRALLDRAFPADASHRIVLATSDARALSRYLRHGLRSSTTVYGFEGPPDPTPVPTPDGLAARPMSEVAEPRRLAATAAIDEALLGARRDEDHAWLVGDRGGWLLERAGSVVGYAYGGRRSGPVATLDAGDMSWAVTLVERAAADTGGGDLSINVPLANTAAADHLLARGYRLDGFTMHLLEDQPRVATDRYVVTSPPFFL